MKKTGIWKGGKKIRHTLHETKRNGKELGIYWSTEEGDVSSNGEKRVLGTPKPCVLGILKRKRLKTSTGGKGKWGGGSGNVMFRMGGGAQKGKIHGEQIMRGELKNVVGPACWASKGALQSKIKNWSLGPKTDREFPPECT